MRDKVIGGLLVLLLFSGLILYMRISESVLWQVKVSRISPLQLGEKVPPFGTRVVYPENRRVEIGREDKIRLLLIYSPLCGSCRQTWPIWREIAEAGNARNIEILALSTLPEDITLKHAREQNIPVPVGLFPHGSETEAYRLTVLPVTLFLDGNQVIGYWSGVLKPEQQKDIYRAILKVLIRHFARQAMPALGPISPANRQPLKLTASGLRRRLGERGGRRG